MDVPLHLYAIQYFIGHYVLFHHFILESAQQISEKLSSQQNISTPCLGSEVNNIDFCFTIQLETVHGSR